MLTITTILRDKAYNINGVATGRPSFAEAVGTLKIRMHSTYDNDYRDYEVDNLNQITVDGSNPSSISNAVELINAVTNFSSASGGSGALVIENDHIFSDAAARDAYFDAPDPHLDELIGGETLIAVGATFQRWDGDDDPTTYDNTNWTDVTAILRGPRGLQGEQGEKGEDGNSASPQTGEQIVQLIEGVDDENLVDDDELDAIGTSIQQIVISGQVMTFTRENGATITVVIPVSLSDNPTLPQISGQELLFISDTTWDASSGSFPVGMVRAGEMFRVSAGGIVDGITFSTNDLVLALINDPSENTYEDNWFKVEGGVHSWGGFFGIITDQNIVDKLEGLGYGRPSSYAAPSVHNLSVDIASRVDVGTDLNVDHVFAFSITNRENISELRLIVGGGDDKAMTVPTIDGQQSQTITLTGIDTSTAGNVTFIVRATDTLNNMHDSNTVTIEIRNLLDHQQAHFGFVDVGDNENSIDLAADDISTQDNVVGTYTVSGIPDNGSLNRIYWAYPPDQTITRVQQAGFTLYDSAQSSGNQFTLIQGVTISGETYDILLMNVGVAVNSNYNGQILIIT